jgi:hypothetical protein
VARQSLPYRDQVLLLLRAVVQPWIAVAVVDVRARLPAWRRMQIQNDVQPLLPAPLDDTIQQSKTFGVVRLEELIVHRHAD